MTDFSNFTHAPDILSVTVTNMDIRRGEHSHMTCPIAQALIRQHDVAIPRVIQSRIDVGNVTYRPSTRAVEFMGKFDRGFRKAVSPQTFHFKKVLPV